MKHLFLFNSTLFLTLNQLMLFTQNPWGSLNFSGIPTYNFWVQAKILFWHCTMNVWFMLCEHSFFLIYVQPCLGFPFVLSVPTELSSLSFCCVSYCHPPQSSVFVFVFLSLFLSCTSFLPFTVPDYSHFRH